MHWVDRGPEPGGLGHIRQAYTPRWVQFYLKWGWVEAHGLALA